uniref:Chromosome 19 open reading frame 12 n=1 Tax=Taeniopygia guttata TaxID=59729 RepID=A0A674G8X6_TAEGU|nr:protein C19orf12 homolog isoform X2 [Taeniopygia guttata]
MMATMIRTAAGFGDAGMPIRVDDVMKLLSHVATVKGMKAAVTHSGRGAMLTGASAFLGGMLGGPPGIAVGGAVGGLIGWLTSEDFKPVLQVLMELSAAEKQELCNATMPFVKNLCWTGARHLIDLVVSKPALMEQISDMLISYLANELKAELKYS